MGGISIYLGALPRVLRRQQESGAARSPCCGRADSQRTDFYSPVGDPVGTLPLLSGDDDRHAVLCATYGLAGPSAHHTQISHCSQQLGVCLYSTQAPAYLGG